MSGPRKLPRYIDMAKADIRSCLEALGFDAEGIHKLTPHERRFWMKKLVAAQELIEKAPSGDDTSKE